ncbi:hypothetical protein SCHPADRAFT_942255 [Schizopora paradoxa]|uniref:Uncharacterized protein n=1 Tax=Schizopora paradoxa TaxID=27342 RepID=A0A0H2RH40_9AGAM|nr:hypothetical protein SCHPADRAFT_942255 [Schizopora paradoxa]
MNRSSNGSYGYNTSNATPPPSLPAFTVKFIHRPEATLRHYDYLARNTLKDPLEKALLNYLRDLSTSEQIEFLLVQDGRYVLLVEVISIVPEPNEEHTALLVIGTHACEFQFSTAKSSSSKSASELRR